MVVIPRQDALGGVAAADEIDFVIGAVQLARDVDEEAAFGGRHFVARAGAAQHFQPVVETGAVEFFVRICARDNAYGFIHNVEGRVDQGQVSSRRGIESAREDSALALHRRDLSNVAEFRPPGSCTE